MKLYDNDMFIEQTFLYKYIGTIIFDCQSIYFIFHLHDKFEKKIVIIFISKRYKHFFTSI